MKKQVKNLLKRLPPVRRYRARKRLHQLVLQYMLTEDEIRGAADSPERRRALIARQEARFPEKAEELNGLIDHVIQGADVADSEALRLDMKFRYYAYGYSPNEYIAYGLSGKSEAEMHSFISDRESLCYAYRLNDYNAWNVFMDKMNTYLKFREYYQRDAICILDQSDFDAYLAFTEKHPVFVKKDVSESCGRSVERIDLATSDRTKEELFAEFLQTKKIILEECVHQSSVLASLNASSVNTVRCFTLYTKHGVLIPWCFMKVGRSGSFVDNGGAGGILVGIDCKTGQLSTDGIDEYGRWYPVHPDSGVAFQGFQLPQWEEMLALCRQMAVQVPKVPWIGWDMAHTDDGWVVIEGNAASEMIGPQATGQAGLRQKMNQYMKDVRPALSHGTQLPGARSKINEN